MIRLNSISEAEKLKFPDTVTKRMQQIETMYIIYLEPDDDLSDIPELGEDGLFGIIDNEWIGFDYVRLHRKGAKRIYELLVIIDSCTSIVLFLEDHPSLDDRLRFVLEIQIS